MAKRKRRTGDAGQAIRDAVGGVFSCGNFFQSEFELPAGVGAQLSMTGMTPAYGNGGTFSDDSLAAALSAYPAMRRMSPACINRLAARKRFTVMCGNIDRCVAIFGCINELVRCGITKIIIAAYTNEERDNLWEALSLMRAGLDGVSTSCFGTRGAENGIDFEPTRRRLAESKVYGFLTSEKPEVMLIGQASFTRGCNLIRRGGEFSLASYLARAAPVVLTSSESVDSARSMAAAVELFAPLSTICFTGEVRQLRDAVIFHPDDTTVFDSRPKSDDMLEQLGF